MISFLKDLYDSLKNSRTVMFNVVMGVSSGLVLAGKAVTPPDATLVNQLFLGLEGIMTVGWTVGGVILRHMTKGPIAAKTAPDPAPSDSTASG